MLNKLTKDLFSDYLGETFSIQIDETQRLNVELVEVSSLPLRFPLMRPKEEKCSREPFTIVFKGPHAPPLSQQMYTIEHESLKTIERLFLVPIGMDQEGRYYEAIFN